MRVNWGKRSKYRQLDYGSRSVRCWFDDSEESREIEAALIAMKVPIIVMKRTESHGIRNPFALVVMCIGHRAFDLGSAIQLIDEAGVGQIPGISANNSWTQLPLIIDST